MAGVHNFRSALGGFNREDVVRYIEFINNKHNTEVAQLNNQLQMARDALNRATADNNTDQLKAQLEEANERIAELEALLEQQPQAPQAAPEKTGDELEAYRRAERAERLARDRAALIYTQANAALADATVKVEEVSDNMTALAEQMTTQVHEAKVKLQEAVASMYAIRPEEE